ncbi:Kre5p Ecym_5056 [Eremothecium cymbalariae DBVPG|uniref:Killer toxin-resistance protein 5 n=1 Tax=Eremothecium cymbalariae (strain CBS 270.75 / DBVPG 7215 / KCTC 17166 / NRRL Y-17582) TaxID=931890 RepID=I6NCQ5_ERECY|nr:hypothetical protein Ecym_5056 [Eremothecium cymbalariae DBVPG\
MLLLGWLLPVAVVATSVQRFEVGRLWQSVVRVGIEERSLWYGAITGAEDDFTVDELWDMLDPDESTLLNLVYDMHSGWNFPVEEGGKLNWFELNNKRYWKTDDSYYLKSGELESQRKIPDLDVLFEEEGVIGVNSEAPLIVFYGDPATEEFEAFNRNLYHEAMDGKLRLVWRPTGLRSKTPENKYSKYYPYDYTLKAEAWNQEVIAEVEIPREFSSTTYRLGNVSQEELETLDLKATTLILKRFKDTKNLNDTIQYARQIIDNFPLIASQLANIEVDVESAAEVLDACIENGISYDSIGVYVNGQQWKLTALNPWSFIMAIISERKKIKGVLSTLQSQNSDIRLHDAKNFLTKYSQIGVLNLQDLQPVRYDFHRIPGFSESVIYFNNLEEDPQYKNLSSDISVFYEKSEFGEIPAYKENWNEIVFVIDFDNLRDQNFKDILAGLHRSLNVVESGYPQRIGLLPLYRGKENEYVRNIYKLKDQDLSDLKSYLKSFNANDFNITSDASVPSVKEILQKFRITDNSIIINGQIHPFKKNSWNYFVASTIKHDVTYLKRALKKSKSENVRDVLHARSFTHRDQRLIPDFFEDAIYTTTNNSIFGTLKDRVVTYNSDKTYNILHTITLVDDFNTKQAIERLINLINIELKGLRIRLIHKGELSAKWKELCGKIASNDNILYEYLTKISKRASSKAKSDPSVKNALREWLLDLPLDLISQDSFCLINGRYFHFNSSDVLTNTQWHAILQRESRRTIDVMNILNGVIPTMVNEKVDPDFIEQLSSYATYLFYVGANIFNNGVDFTSEATLPRMNVLDFFDQKMLPSVIYNGNVNAEVNITVIMDPLEERSQKFLHLVDIVQSLSFVNLNIVLLPTKSLAVMPIHRIYSTDDLFEDADDLFFVSRDIPSTISAENSSIIVQAHVFQDELISKATVEGVGGVCLEIVNPYGIPLSRAISMTTFGYAQFSLPAFERNLTIRSCDESFTVSSFSNNAKPDFVPVKSFDVVDLKPHRVVVKIESKIKNHKGQKLFEYDNEINVHVTIHDLRDEYLFKQKLLTILSNLDSNGRVHFWLSHVSELSIELKRILTFVELNTDQRVLFSRITYAWPVWLRPQRFSERRQDVSRIMFLDVMFPYNHINKLIILSLKETDTPDLAALKNLKTRAYFTMKQHRGNGYWEEGYWKKFLGENNLKFYDFSSTFVVDMARYRDTQAGHYLRIHYQRLSSDINSLLNIDGDLANSLQLILPIRTLRVNKDLNIPHPEKEFISKFDADVEAFFASLDQDNDLSTDADTGTDSDYNTGQDSDLYDPEFEHDEL